jgi:hypothetical protein
MIRTTATARIECGPGGRSPGQQGEAAMTSKTRVIGAVLIGLMTCATGSGVALCGDEGLLDVLNGYWHPELAEEGHPIGGTTVQIGSMRLKFRDGLAVPLSGTDGEMVGMYFSGHGSYRYRSEDPIDREVIGRNVSKVSNLHVSEDFGVGEHFTEAMVLAAGPWLDTLRSPGARAEGEQEPVPPDSDLRAEASKLADRQMHHAAHRLAGVRLNGLEGYSYVCMEITGDRELATFEYDATEDFVERLYFVEKDDRTWARELVSQQVLDARDDIVQPALVLTEASFDIATENNKSGTIDSDLVLRIERDGTRYAQFYLVSHRDQRGSYILDGSNALHVEAITDESGRALPFAHARHELLVDLGTARKKGDTVRLEVETAGEVFTGMGGERHDRYFELLGVDWYPTPLGTRTPGFTFSLRIKTAKPYRPVTSGKQVSFHEDGDFYILESARDRPSKYLAVFAGRYKTYEEVFDGLPIRVHSYAIERRGLPEKMAALANGFIRYYEELLGPYPFDELDIVEVPEYGFGVAPSGVVLLTTEAYKPLASLSRFYVRGVNSRLAHEIAHHWFGHVAMVGDYRDNWLSESFAEYVSALAMEALKPKGSTKIVGFKDMLVDWRNASDECRNVGSVLAANQIAGNEGYLDRIGLLYNRGPMLLHMLRTMVGDDQFSAMLRRFLERADMGVVTTADFRAAVSEVRGFDMAWFFEQWISRSGIPDVRFEYRVTTVEGRQILSGTLNQDPESFKKIVVPVVIELADGQTIVRVVVQNEAVTDFRFEIPGRPRKVSIDPHRNNLAHYHTS